MRFAAIAAVMLGFAPVTAFAQSAPCGTQLSGCSYVHQSLVSGAAQFGIVAAAGNPVPGVEGTRGVTLGLIPRTSATLRVSGAAVRLPDLEGDEDDAVRSLTPIAVKLGTATRLLDGSAAGTGSLDLLLEGGLLTGTGEGGRTSVVLGAGARLGLLRETFSTPGVALSGIYRHTGRMQYGAECTAAQCGSFDGWAEFGVNDLSARLTVGKRVGPVGLAAGAGWDRFSTTDGVITYEIGAPFPPASGTEDVDVSDSRWSAFVNLSRGLTIGSLVAEAGWMTGGDTVADLQLNSWNPGQGTFFGSLALRIQL